MMSEGIKIITILNDGGFYDISNKEEFKEVLELLDAKFLENVETKRRVLGYALLAS